MGGGVGATGGLGVEFRDLFKPAVVCAQVHHEFITRLLAQAPCQPTQTGLFMSTNRNRRLTKQAEAFECSP